MAIRQKAFRNLEIVLKEDGRLVITDNFNDGLVFDSASSRIIFALIHIYEIKKQKKFQSKCSKSA